jgi:hypothetical protein
MMLAPGGTTRGDGMATRTRWIYALSVLGLVGWALWTGFGPGATSTASWRIDGSVDPAATEVPLMVNENACASGRTAEGRIEEPDVDYRRDAVVVTIRVRERSGDQDCPGNPDTPYVLRLDEPVGNRALLDGGQRPPAPPDATRR